VEEKMAKLATPAKAKPKPVATFDTPITVEVFVPEFVPFATLKALSPELLEKGKHRIEIGTIQGGCCRKLVYAVIQKGMVTSIEASLCAESTHKPSKETVALFKTARSKVKDLGVWHPVPVTELSVLAATRPDRFGTGAGCVYFCHGDYCVFCCVYPPRCWIETRTASPDIVLN
jgi:hypothetical protein